jgi:hypothetical protein
VSPTFIHILYHPQFFFPWVFCFFLHFSFAMTEIELSELPADENEALRMLADGTLDSAVWRKIEPYYTMPIRVPQGDLRILQDIFPELPRDLPSSPSALSAYLPWNDSAQRKFYSDFPILVAFGPILSFENGPQVQVPGHVGLYYSRQGTSDTARQYALFSVGDPARVSASGRVDFTDAYGRWFRRVVSAVPAPGVRFSGGNFSPRRGISLFSGYFPSDGDSGTDVSQNWLYGASRTWNGAALTFESNREDGETPTANGEAFFHAGRTETMGQLSGGYRFSRQIFCYGGVSYMRSMVPDNPIKDFGYYYAGLEIVPAPSWKGEIQSSVNGNNPTAVPWLLTLSHTVSGSNFTGTLIGIPGQYVAPRSATVRLLRMRAGDTTNEASYLMSADLLYRRRIHGAIVYSPHLNCIWDNNRLHYVSTGMELSGSAWCTYHLWYHCSSRFGGSDTARRQQVMAKGLLPLSKNVRADCSGTIIYLSNGYWSDRLRISFPVRTGDALELAPLFMLYRNRKGQWERTAGIVQRFSLYKKTFSNITIEQEFPCSSWRTIRARGAMSFFL